MFVRLTTRRHLKYLGMIFFFYFFFFFAVATILFAWNFFLFAALGLFLIPRKRNEIIDEEVTTNDLENFISVHFRLLVKNKY